MKQNTIRLNFDECLSYMQMQFKRFSFKRCRSNIGINESKRSRNGYKYKMTSSDRLRLNTDANYLYLPGKWELHGISAKDIEKMMQFSARISQQLQSYMLISQPKCEYVPIKIKAKRWLYVIVVKRVPGVFISKKDIPSDYNATKTVVKQGVLYVRIADTTIGAEPNVAAATEHIRVWKNYINWLRDTEMIDQETVGGKQNDQS